MLDTLKFIFSSGWVWLGCIVILGVVFEGVEAVVKAARRPKPATRTCPHGYDDRNDCPDCKLIKS